MRSLQACNFYPRSPCGERPYYKDSITRPADFYPRSPCGERPRTTASAAPTTGFLSTLSLRRATSPGKIPRHAFNISIHALLAESDQLYINGPTIAVVILSTLSLRRATLHASMYNIDIKNFYPRSPCGERPALSQSSAKSSPISIHALLAESDRLQGFLLAQGHNFYPRSPCGERHLQRYLYLSYYKISIHALLAESDFFRHKKALARL